MNTILTNRVTIKSEKLADFVDWQAKFNAAIAIQPGFLSLEILSPSLPDQPAWLLVQRFQTAEQVELWRASSQKEALWTELNQYLIDRNNIETTSDSTQTPAGVTEVFVTQVNPENEPAYMEWMAKIHQAEAKFPGFKGVYMQSPRQSGGTNWITFLHFDTPENLDHWLHSPERMKVLSEAEHLIKSLESHRMISPYAGWFASIAKEGSLPSVWKQTMIVLLVLFPIVMLELKYLSPLTASLNSSLATFIGNAISVTLISWPMMPIAIFFLGWWLTPNQNRFSLVTVLGTVLMIFLYVLEIIIFWNLL